MGVLGRAQRLYPVEICAVVFLSNHYHLLLRVPDAKRLADFMGYVNSNLAREVGRLTDWRDKIWSRRYQSIPVSHEDAAQAGRFRYLLANGAKEGLVQRPQDWPGVHGIHALLDGEPLRGYWFDRTKEYAARSRREAYSKYQYATEETVVLSPLPCWSHLPPERVREHVADLIAEIEAEAEAVRRETGREPLGVEAILRQKPHDRPHRPKKSPAPGWHAATRAARRALQEAYRSFLAAFREAAEKLKAGDRLAQFPMGSFPPGLPFVDGLASLPARAP